jgi:hypothetical protein
LFLTVYVHKEDIHADVLQQLTSTAHFNMRTHQELASAFTEKYPHGNPDTLMNDNFPAFFSIMLPKVLANLARTYGWFGEHRKIYTYNRPDVGDYYMMTSVVCYDRIEKAKHLPGPAGDPAFLKRYIPEIASIFRFKPVNVNQVFLSGGATLRNSIASDLKSIVDFREAVLADLAE